MNNFIEEMEILWASGEKYDVDQQLAAFDRLNKSATSKDIPQLIEYLESDKNDFWTRELLARPICRLGGPKYLPQLLKALSLNEEEGYDNDGFENSLVEMAETQPKKSKEKLKSLLSQSDFKYKRDAEWLLQFCKE